MQVRGNALMHYIDSTTLQQVVEAASPPAGTNPANTCGVCCDIVSGTPTNWRCNQSSGTCTLQSQDQGGGKMLYYCTCS